MRSGTLLLVALLLTLPTAFPSLSADDAPSVLLVAVHPGGARDWEHVIVSNPGALPVDLSGWSLTDGEGRWTLPKGCLLGAGERASVGLNSTAFALLWGRALDVTAVMTGSFCLADRGDSLELLDPDGATVDQLAYGATGDTPPGWRGDPVPTPSSMPWGRLLSRRAPVDTDAASDWSGWTEPRCGWLETPDPPGAVPANVSCFVTPEGGWEALSWAIDTARESLDIALYDITSLDVAAAVADRARRGVDTRLLVEGAPVGMDAGDEAWRSSLLSALVDAGVEVWVTSPAVKGESHRPYRYHHEKYCVVDGERAVVTTENWCAGSFPVQGDSDHASRGWGAVIEGRGLASDLLRVFENDLHLSAGRWAPEGTGPLSLPSPLAIEGGPTLQRAEVRLLVGPEGWGDGLSHLLSPLLEAEESILLELAYLEVWWGDRVSPLVEALVQAATRGVEVRVVLDPGGDGAGSGTLECLHDLAARRGVPGLRGVLASDLPGVSRVHTKGAVVDGRVAVVGSLNWGWSSVGRNREVVAVVEGSEAVRPLVEAIGADWNASAGSRAPSPPRSLVLEAASRWGGRSFPRHRLEPMGPGDAAGDWSARDGAPTLEDLLRTVVIVAAFLSTWALDRRYALTARAWAWTRGRVRRLRRRVEASSPPPSSGEAAPGASRTTSPGRDPGTGRGREGSPRGPPPGGTPRGPAPPDRAPRVVVLEEVP